MHKMTRLRWIAAAILLCLLVFSAVSSAKRPPPETITFVSFKPTEFPFVTTVPDTGEGKAGGWQVAKANLGFTHLILPTGAKKWSCSLTIEMPLRTEFMGRVDATRAATMSAEVAESAGKGMDFSMPEGIFCRQFVSDVAAAFKLKYPKLGERVTK